jgi:chlorophyllide a reductase subunit Y
MRDFFEGVGTGHAAGVWEDVPRDRPEFRKRNLALAAMAKKKQVKDSITEDAPC